MRTEVTPDLLCVNDYGSYSRKAQGAELFGLLSFVPKLCPKDVRNIETYLKISKLIEILEPLKTSAFLSNVIVFFRLDFSVASTTRVKSEVQVLYRPRFL
jgi:hypothetical protein